MKAQQKVAPYDSEDLKIEEFKLDDAQPVLNNPNNKGDKNDMGGKGVNYGDYMKKRDENKANHERK